MKHTVTYNHQSQFIELTSKCQSSVKLSSIATYSTGLTYAPEDVNSDGIIVLRSGNIQDGSITLEDIVRVNKPIKDSLYVKKGDILMCSRNGSASLVGKTAIVGDYPERMTFGAFMTLIKTDIPEYLNAFFSTPSFRYQVSMGKSSTMNQITQKMLDSIELPLVSVSEQKQFAAIVRQADKSKFDGFKSQFIEMTSSCNDSCKLSDLVELPIEAAKKQYHGLDTINYIDISSIDDGSKSFSYSTEYLFQDAPSRAQQCVKHGDILYSTVRPNLQNFGIITTHRENLVASSGFCVLRPKTGLRNFIMAVISSDSFTAKMVDKAQGGVFPAVNQSFILGQEIPCPPEETIQAISAIVRQADKSKYYVQNKLNYICHILTKQIPLRRCS